MKGVILSGGVGTRLYPITYIVNKSVLPVYNKPMIYYPFRTLIQSGITDIAVIIENKFGSQVVEMVKKLNLPNKLKVSFIVQKKPLGMSDAIAKCRLFAQNDAVLVIPSDNVFERPYSSEVKTFKKGALCFAREVPDPERFGVPKYSRNGDIAKIIEKPKNPKTNLAVTAPYFFDNSVFGLIKRLIPSKRGELEITDLLNLYIKKGKLTLRKREEFWMDVGTFDSLITASKFVLENRQQFELPAY